MTPLCKSDIALVRPGPWGVVPPPDLCRPPSMHIKWGNRRKWSAFQPSLMGLWARAAPATREVLMFMEPSQLNLAFLDNNSSILHVRFAVTKSRVFTMAFFHVKAARDFLSELYKTRKITSASVVPAVLFPLQRAKNVLHVALISASPQE